MLGQHPQAYGLPELNLFLADTLGEIIHTLQHNRPHGLSGLLRTVAELEYHAQTPENISRAQKWLAQHQHWTTQQVFAWLVQQTASRVLVEKSPSTALHASRLVRLHRNFPDAYYLHLVRHPRPTCKSVHELQQKTAILGNRRSSQPAYPEDLWLRINMNILRFTARLPPGQTQIIQGEQLLSQPESYLRQIAEWLNLRTDSAAIAAMLHPEQSPYACLGPLGAPFGHDPNFLQNPHFEQRSIPATWLDGPLEWPVPDGRTAFSTATLKIARMLGYQ